MTIKIKHIAWFFFALAIFFLTAGIWTQSFKMGATAVPAIITTVAICIANLNEMDEVFYER